MQIEIANRIQNGRAVGTDFVVTNRDAGKSSIVFRSGDRDDCVAFIENAELERMRETYPGADWFFVTNNLTKDRVLVSVPKD